MKHRIDHLLIESSKKFSANCRKPWYQFADINIAMNFPMISLFVQISGTYGWTNQMPWMRRQEKKKRTVWDIKGKKKNICIWLIVYSFEYYYNILRYMWHGLSIVTHRLTKWPTTHWSLPATWTLIWIKYTKKFPYRSFIFKLVVLKDWKPGCKTGFTGQPH